MHKVLPRSIMIENKSAKLTEAASVLHILDPELNGLTDENFDEFDDETVGNINHLGKGMLNMLCNVVPHCRDKAAEMDEALSFSPGLSPAAATKKKRKKAKVSQEIFIEKRSSCFLT